AGANKVYLASAAPPVRFPNVYGIDMPSADELIAHGRTTEEIAKLIEVDKLIYQELDDLIEASREGNTNVDGFECSVFTGEYVTGDVDDAYLSRISNQRNDQAKLNREKSSGEASVIGLHNSRKVN
ncbi:MAG: amidophosphoribosyltransferase, partial [Pseudomonadales bacterium]